MKRRPGHHHGVMYEMSEGLRTHQRSLQVDGTTCTRKSSHGATLCRLTLSAHRAHTQRHAVCRENNKVVYAVLWTGVTDVKGKVTKQGVWQQGAWTSGS